MSLTVAVVLPDTDAGGRLRAVELTVHDDGAVWITLKSGVHSERFTACDITDHAPAIVAALTETKETTT